MNNMVTLPLPALMIKLLYLCILIYYNTVKRINMHDNIVVFKNVFYRNIKAYNSKGN